MNSIKNRLIFQAAFGIVATFLIAGSPNRVQSQHHDQVPNQCSIERKNQYYKDFQASYEGDSKDQAKALEAAKKYLACPDYSKDQEETVAKLNLAVGQMLSLKQSYIEAVPHFIKAASYNSTIKTSPQVYAHLAEAYEQGYYQKLAEAYERISGKDGSDENLLKLENIYQIVDRMIDAYARAVALADVELPNPSRRTIMRERQGPTDPSVWIETLSVFYKFRHNGSDAGLKELIATVLSKPLPLEPVPITSLPSRKK